MVWLELIVEVNWIERLFYGNRANLRLAFHHNITCLSLLANSCGSKCSNSVRFGLIRRNDLIFMRQGGFKENLGQI